MAERYTFKQLAKDVLEHEGVPLSPSQIWEKGKELGLADKVGSEGDTPEKTISSNISVELRTNSENTPFVKYSSRPSLFFLKGKTPKEGFEIPSMESLGNISKSERKPSFYEESLHALLVRFFSIKYNIYMKTINQSKSPRCGEGKNEWIHPDIVGVYLPFKDFTPSTRSFQKKLYWSAVKFFSFELKREITLSDCKQYFFQAVSNSSWANEGYLVSYLIDEGDENLMMELKRLSNSFGIGIIKLTPGKEEEGKILFSAKTKEELDWETLDNLMQNKDFEKFMKDVERDINEGEITDERKYDDVLDDEKLENHIKDKKIVN